VDNDCRFRLRLHPTIIVHYYRHSWQEKTVLSPTRKVNGDNKDLFKSYTTQELLDELDIIECFEQPERKRRIGEMTKKTNGLVRMPRGGYSILGIILREFRK